MDTQKEREAFDVWYYEQQNEIGYDALLSAWLAAKAQAIPEGFAVVPKEPTEKMIDTGMESFCFPLDNGHFYNHDLIFAYRTMIEAAQEKEVV